MVNFGFPLLSTTFSRASTVLSRDVVMANLRPLQEEILRLEEQLSSGVRLLRPSLDPIAATRVLDFSNRVVQNERFVRNIERVQSRLDRADSTADELGQILDKARTILLEQVQDTSTAQTRLIAAQEVSNLLQRVMDLANQSVEGRFLFGGTATGSAPVASVGGSVLFRGNTEATFFRASEGLVVRENVSADELFGVLSDGIRGLNATGAPVDLNPALTGATRVEDLRRGVGITLGEIVVSGVASATIDLRPARTVADLVEIINQFTATTGVSASTTATGLVLTNTAGPALSVADVPGGRTAAELGIDTGGAAVPSPLVGADLDPALTERTTLASLFLGAGLDPSGLTLEQVFDGVTVTDSFTLAGLNTVGDLVRRINESTAMGRARINPERTGIDVFNRLSGGRMRILENGGATAAALGILYTVERAKLDDLNGGFGIGTVPGPDLRITRKDGVVLNFDLDGRQTVREVVALIDADPGLTAAINPSGGITITDVTGGAGTLTIEDINGSFAAANLGIAGSTGGTFISGTTISFAGVQVEGIFTALIRLRDGLLANDVDAIANARKVLEKAQQNLMEGRAEAGARAAALEFARNRVEQQTEDLKRFISMDRDVDLAEAASLLATKQTILQAALLVASRLLQTSLLNFL